jgi:nicotinate-nucleotide adenylyltransferase
MAEQAREQLALERVIWVPAADPPHKRGQVITPVKDRLEMLRLALADNPHFVLSLVDVERPGPHYTADTLALIASSNQEAELFFLIGSDSLRDLPTWHDPVRLIRQAFLAVVQRPDVTYDLTALETVIPGLSNRLVFVDMPIVGIAAADIRQRVSSGRTIRYLLPSSVEAYIFQHKLYRDL